MRASIHNIRIRKAVAGDSTQVCRLFQEAVSALDTSSYTDAQLQKMRSLCADKSKWEEKINADKYLVAMKQDEICGFCSLQPAGCIDMLYVHPAYRHMGLASALLDALYELADNAQLPAVYTHASLEATPFFEKNGFLVRDVCAKNIDGVHFTTVIVDKRLWPM